MMPAAAAAAQNFARGRLRGSLARLAQVGASAPLEGGPMRTSQRPPRHHALVSRSAWCALAIGTLAAALLAFAQPAAALQTYVYHSQWGSQGSASNQLNFPFHIALGPNGDLFVADTHNIRVTEYTPDGVFVRFMGVPVWPTVPTASLGFDQPQGVAVSSTAVYATEYTYGGIAKYTPNGDFVSAWLGTTSSPADAFNLPSGIAADASGNVYLSDGHNFRIAKFTADGTFVCQFGDYHELTGPEGVAVGPGGLVYVANTDSVVRYTPNASGTAYTKTATWGGAGTPAGDLGGGVLGVACDPFGCIYVTSQTLFRVEKLSPQGALLAKWGTEGSGNGQFTYALGIAVAPSGTVYVGDRDAARIQVFEPLGPHTNAAANLTVKKSKAVTFKFKAIDCVTPKANFVLKILKGTKLKKSLAVGLKNCNTWATKSWKCTLATGHYTWLVYATDQAGRPQQNPIGHKSLTVK
jgi:hypothetical protein